MRIGDLEHDKDRAKLLRKVLETNSRSQREEICATDRKMFRSSLQYAASANRNPAEMKMQMANDIIGGYGVEYAGEVDMRDGPPLEYVNMGDTYDVTLCRFNGSWRVCSVGDIMERHERLFRDR
jgi:hypothetical protein